MESTVIFMVRHGETIWSSENRMAGTSDISLSETGKAHISSLGARLKQADIGASSIYTSPLLRCHQTAEIINQYLNLPIKEEKALREMDYGIWEGKLHEDIIRNNLYSQWDHDPLTVTPPEGENLQAFFERIYPAFLRICEENLGKKVILTAHKTVNRVLLCSILGISITNYRKVFSQFPACLNVVRFYSDKSFKLIAMNDISHYNGNPALETIV